MFDRFTYRQKNYGLLVLVVLMFIVSYKRVFSLTLAVQTEIESQELRKADATHAQTDLEMLQVQVMQLNKNIGKSDLEPDKVQQEILRTITAFSNENDVMLDELQATHNYETVDFNIYSNLVAVKGTFNGLLSLAYYMENEFDYARLTNISIYKEKNLTTKKTALYANLLFQHYRQKIN